MEEKNNSKVCPYCQGEGSYITYTWGVKNKNICRFCSGEGKTKDHEEK